MNIPEPKITPLEKRVEPVHWCDLCNEPILPGDRYYHFPDANVCADCLDDYIRTFRIIAGETEVAPPKIDWANLVQSVLAPRSVKAGER